MSSCLNALSAVTWEDILKPFLGELSETKKTWITRILGTHFLFIKCPHRCLRNVIFKRIQDTMYMLYYSRLSFFVIQKKVYL